MSLVIAVDVDDVVGDLLTPWIARYNERFVDAVYKTPDDIDRWNLTDLMPKHHVELFWNMLEPSIYRRDEVLPFEGALDGVNELRKLGRVVFATSCVNFTSLVQAKFDWLVRHKFLPNADKHGGQRDYIPVIDKSLVAADFLIDDGPHNCHDFVERYLGRDALLVKRPHNRNNRQGLVTVSGVGEAEELIRKYLEEEP